MQVRGLRVEHDAGRALASGHPFRPLGAKPFVVVVEHWDGGGMYDVVSLVAQGTVGGQSSREPNGRKKWRCSPLAKRDTGLQVTTQHERGECRRRLEVARRREGKEDSNSTPVPAQTPPKGLVGHELVSGRPIRATWCHGWTLDTSWLARPVAGLGDTARLSRRWTEA
jgi:hypothetical protein